MYCNKCGHEIYTNARFCTNCGAKTKAAEEADRAAFANPPITDGVVYPTAAEAYAPISKNIAILRNVLLLVLAAACVVFRFVFSYDYFYSFWTVVPEILFWIGLVYVAKVSHIGISCGYAATYCIYWLYGIIESISHGYNFDTDEIVVLVALMAIPFIAVCVVKYVKYNNMPFIMLALVYVSLYLISYFFAPVFYGFLDYFSIVVLWSGIAVMTSKGSLGGTYAFIGICAIPYIFYIIDYFEMAGYYSSDYYISLGISYFVVIAIQFLVAIACYFIARAVSNSGFKHLPIVLNSVICAVLMLVATIFPILICESIFTGADFGALMENIEFTPGMLIIILTILASSAILYLMDCEAKRLKK